MTAIAKIEEAYSEADFETVAELASENYGPRDIALNLQRSIYSFMHVWRDKNSQLRKAYDRGIMEIEIIKRQKLNESIKSGSTTAIQQHDKHSAAQRFEDIKSEIFAFE